MFSFIYLFASAAVCYVTFRCLLGTKCYFDVAEDKHFKTTVPTLQELVLIIVIFIIYYTLHSAH